MKTFPTLQPINNDIEECNLRWGERWLAVDLDGTLCEYDGFKGHDVFGAIVKPINDAMTVRRNSGWKIAIFTARADTVEHAEFVSYFLVGNGIEYDLITNFKKPYFTEFWDDRAMPVERNEGKFIDANKNEKDICSLDVQVEGSYYTDMIIQPAEYCEYNKIPALESGVIKYVSRHSNKGGRKDLEKAIDLINMLIDMRYMNTGREHLINRINKIKESK
jgi:hypothetical protein